MALGGGTFTAQNKALPGSYINIVSAAAANTNVSERGIVAAISDWGYSPVAEGGIYELTAENFAKNSVKIFGRETSDGSLMPIREIFKHANMILLASGQSGGTKASNKYAEAANPGAAGNLFSIKIEQNVDDSNKWDVITLYKNNVADKQSVAKTTGTTDNHLTDNGYVTFKKNVALEAAASVAMTGGADGSDDGAALQSSLNLLEQYSFNTLVCYGNYPTDTALLINFTKRMRDEMGVKFQLITDGMTINSDYEGAVSVSSPTISKPNNATELVWWVAGAIAGCPINRSLTNTVYDGELEVITNLTQTELIDKVNNGKFVFHRVGNEIRVLKDVNSLVTTTSDKGEEFKHNQTIRVADQIANDIAYIFNTKYIGRIPNDYDGRIALWNELVKYHNELQTMRAIQDFRASDITVEPGDEKTAVVVNDVITITGTMEKLYMTVIVQ